MISEASPTHISISKAAIALGTSRCVVRRHIESGRLRVFTSELDKRSKLIPLEQIQKLRESAITEMTAGSQAEPSAA